MAASLGTGTVWADDADSAVEAQAAAEVQGFVKAMTYSDYYDSVVGKARPDVTVPLTFTDADAESGATVEAFEGKENIIVWRNQTGRVNFTVDVPETGNYNMEMSYYPIVGGNVVSEVSVLIDGVSPYDTATRIEVARRFTHAHPIQTDARDNEMLSPQVESPEWLYTPFKDNDGMFNEPLLFFLEAGTHEISLTSEKAAFAIEYVNLYQYPEPPAYVAPDQSELSKTSGASTIRLQGEKYSYTNNQQIMPVAVRNEHNVDPANPVKQRYNAVGVWDKTGQTVTWSYSIPKAGYYKVGIQARQNELRGLATNRRITIDGKVPNEYYDTIKFKYSTDWAMFSPLTESGEEVYIYLDEGKHTIALESIPGEIGDVMRKLDAIVYEINGYYMDILMITGPNPDQYTDYNLHIEIPALVGDFNRMADELMACMAEVERIAGTKGTTATSLERLADVLYQCAKKPRDLPKSIRNTAIKSSVSAVSAWMRENRAQNLRVDYIEIVPAYGTFTETNTKNALAAIGFFFDGFIGSFFEDYTRLSDYTQDSIDVWANVGRDQTNIIKQMTDSTFTEQYRVPVAINLVQGAIMEAVLAGKGPDVVLFLGGEIPVNLAIRELALPVDGYEGFDEVAARFQNQALVPYQYEGHTYGIPITRGFPALFYRKDLLAEVGVNEPPETWQEFIDILPALQRRYMQPGLVLPMAGTNANISSVAPSVEIGHTFALMMLQRGDDWYNDTQTETTFNQTAAYESFEMWTDFYNIYKFDQVYDAFTRFRTGEAPIVINNYNTFYNLLDIAAPEIKGLWDFTLVPGTPQADGSISHAANSSGTGAVILKGCNNTDGAWQFIKWFTETQQSVDYARNVEGVLGALGRVDVANVDAVQKLNWSASELKVINAQMAELSEIPITPSSYVVTREIMNAFREVVNNKYNPRYELNEFNVKINAEITRKRQNLGLD
jgi:ABC-type glycerol-3-phosphate transport system substrate-binding protein